MGIAALIVGSLICHGTWHDNPEGSRTLYLDKGCEITLSQCTDDAARVQSSEGTFEVLGCATNMSNVDF